MNHWTTIPSEEIIQKTIDALGSHGISATIVDTGDEAKEKVLSIIPKGSEVMTMSSVTLETIGVTKEINESGKYNSVKSQLLKMDRKTQGLQMQKLGSAPEYAIGSVHAVSEDGKILIASNTGSQLSAYVYGSANVFWVVGAQKIVKDLDEGIKRIYEYILPLESVRLNKQYNISTGSFVSKLLIINKEVNPQRSHVIFVRKVLGF